MDKQLDIITTSLEALLQRGTSPKNVGRDNAAFDAFCGLVNKEPDCIPTAAKLIVSKMQSMQEWEAVQALQLLEACMQRCGSPFHAEVGKFRFLNELIKLISPKYLGSLTPDTVRTEIIQLLYLWMLEYPKETKIREAYEMLKKQGVVQVDPSVSGRCLPPPSAACTCTASSKPLPPSRHSSCSILEDANQSKLLQRLLQSKRPEDLQAANKLIKSMVSEEEKKMELRCQIMSEMESIQNNVSLLTEMLDNYSGGAASDWELIRELHATCESFRAQLVTRAQTLPSGDDDLFQLVISSNESLNKVLAKYNATLATLSAEEANVPLLDMNSARPSPQHSLPPTSSHLNDLVDLVAQGPPPHNATPPSHPNNVDLLNDLLSNSIPSGTPSESLLGLSPGSTQSSLTSSHNSHQWVPPSTLSSLAPDDISLGSADRLSAPSVSKTPFNDLLDSVSQPTSRVTPASVDPPQTQVTNASSQLLSPKIEPSHLLSNSSLFDLKSSTTKSYNVNLFSQPSAATAASPWVNASSPPSLGSEFQSSFSGERAQQLHSPTTLNKLEALRDLDEMVGQSLSRLGLYEDGARKDSEGVNGNNGGGRNGCGDTHNAGEGCRLTSRGGTSNVDSNGAVKCEETKGDDGERDSTLLQEDDEQLLLDHSMVGEGVKSQESEPRRASNPAPLATSLCDSRLADVQISLENIEPSGVHSICAMDNVTMQIRLTRARPKPNVAVFEVVATSRHASPLCSYLFQPVVPKGYKLKLQPPSSTSLPAFNPAVLPPPAIRQIMLVACPQSLESPPARLAISLKFVVSYELEGETVSDMGEVVDLPLSET